MPRFTKGNQFASAGGHARAAQLSPSRRAEIARNAGRRGFAALVARYFAGDDAKAREYVAQLGRWAYFQQYSDMRSVYKPHVAPRPVLPGANDGMPTAEQLADEITF